MSEYEVEEAEQTIEKKKFKKKSEETPNYDAKSTEARKYIVGGAAVFIPDLCEALREDWYPRATDEDFKKIANLRDEIKYKVAEDWRNDSKDGVGWSATTLWKFWPDWLAERHSDARQANIDEHTYDQFRDYQTKANDNKADLTKLNQSMPEPPPEPEEEEPTPVEHNEKLLTPKQIYDLSMYHIGELWRILGKYNSQPGPKTNIETAILAPSEKYRLRLLKGLEPGDRAALIHQISHLNTFCVGFLKQVRTVLSEEKGVDK